MHRRLAPWIAALTLMTLPIHAALGAESASSFTTPEAAFEALSSEDNLTEERISEAGVIMDRAVKRSPKNGRWIMGRSLVETYQGDPEEAYALAKKALKLAPDDAMVQYHFGNAAFDNIGNVSFINKGAVAKKGKKAYERAIELDPTMIDPQVGLAQYYLFAPSIAGGSVKKAREYANSIKAIEGGASEGAALLMQIEGKEQNWEAFAEASEEAIALSESEAERQEVRFQLAFIQAFQAVKTADALLTIEDIRQSEIPEDKLDTLNYLHGYCLLAEGDTTGAIERFEETLRINADAQNTRHLLAGCYEGSGKPLLAAKHYEEFAKRFSDDDRAKDAKKRAKKLRKQASKNG